MIRKTNRFFSVINEEWTNNGFVEDLCEIKAGKHYFAKLFYTLQDLDGGFTSEIEIGLQTATQPLSCQGATAKMLNSAVVLSNDFDDITITGTGSQYYVEEVVMTIKPPSNDTLRLIFNAVGTIQIVSIMVEIWEEC